MEGHLQSRKYTNKDGIERTAVEVIASEMVMLSGRDEDEDDVPFSPAISARSALLRCQGHLDAAYRVTIHAVRIADRAIAGRPGRGRPAARRRVLTPCARAPQNPVAHGPTARGLAPAVRGAAMKLWQVEWRTVGKAALREYRNDDVAGLAAEMAFNCLFALFPFALFLSALTGLVGRLVGAHELFATSMGTVYRALPPASARALEEPLREVLAARHGSALSAGAGALLALAFASNGVATTMKALNRAYGVEETRSFLRARLVALALTLVLGLLLVGGFVLLLFGDGVRAALAGRLGSGAAVDPAWRATRLVLVPAA